MNIPHKKFKKSWLRKHVNDTYVKLAQQQGFRSRAAYKLLFIDKKDELFRPGQIILDLGAAPGAWSQLALEKVGATGKIIALDRLPIKALSGITFIQGDLKEQSTLDTLYQHIKPSSVDLILSDMAPNLTGIASIDQPSSHALCQLALNISQKSLKKGGTLLVKCFQGKGFETYLKTLRTSFKQVISRKPDASRNCSSEIYLVAKGYHI